MPSINNCATVKKEERREGRVLSLHGGGHPAVEVSLVLLLHFLLAPLPSQSFGISCHILALHTSSHSLRHPTHVGAKNKNSDEPLQYDDGDFFEDDDEDSDAFARLSQQQQFSTKSEDIGPRRTKSNHRNRSFVDLSGCSTRQFSLGYDVILTSFAGSLGFDEVTDWEYYYDFSEEEDDDDDDRNKNYKIDTSRLQSRKVVQPLPFDSTKPKRTRLSSGSVVRLFRGEFKGRLGSTLRSRGMDNRVLLKEFAGELAMDLAMAEIQAVFRCASSGS